MFDIFLAIFTEILTVVFLQNIFTDVSSTDEKPTERNAPTILFSY